MDHHCVITDNCVGKGNMPYFFQFTGWATFALFIGLFVFIYNVNWRNVESGYGAQGFIDGFWMAPQLIFIKYIFNMEAGL